MGRLFLLEEITSKEMLFSTGDEKFLISIRDFAIDYLEQHL
ncbi:hypothetical protein [Bacillus cereus]|nr:hypothetical protein [Bacillus cereus]MDF9530213.1 hypothetical protein [Bacillus cereus]MDG1578380.1 hypothetical protein [Bacillus cereus]